MGTIGSNRLPVREIGLAVDDMMYYRRADCSAATRLLASDSDVCLWSWRIGDDLQPDPCLELREDHWRAGRRRSPMPYRYCFHTDGSLYRRRDLQSWLGLLPLRRRRTLNSDWLRDLDADWPYPPTHVAPTETAADRWLRCVRPPDRPQ